MTDETKNRTLYEERPNLLISLQASYQQKVEREKGETPDQYRTRRLAWASEQLGFPVETFNDLSRDDAHFLLNVLNPPDTGLVSEDGAQAEARRIRDKSTMVMEDYQEGTIDRELAKRALSELGWDDESCERLLKIAQGQEGRK